jgi:tRNA A-37 threonylcarbamoyl transferase component Bud32
VPPTDLPVLAELGHEYRIERGARGVCALHRSLAAALLAAGYGPDSDAPLSPSDQSGRRQLGELVLDGERLLVRRFTHGGLLRWLTGERFLDAERPFREILLSARLRGAGLRTPEIVAARARRLAGAGHGLEVVTRRIEGAVDLGRALVGEARVLPPRSVSALLGGAGRMVRAMHEAGFFHADLTPRNLLVERAALSAEALDRAPRYWILDLDRSEFCTPLAEGARARNLRRLYRHVARLTAEGHLDLRRGDFMRFLRGYEPRRAERAELWRRVRRGHVRSRAVHAGGWALERRFGGPRD